MSRKKLVLKNMGKEKKIIVSCEDANHFCDKNQYREATLIEKIKLNIHLIYCKACRKYSTNNGRLSRLLKNPKLQSIDNATKTNMKEELKRKMGES